MIDNKTIYLRIRTLQQLQAALSWGHADAVIADPFAKGIREEIEASFPGKSCSLYYELPYVIRKQNLQRSSQLVEGCPSGVGLVVKNIDELGMLVKYGYEGPLIADPFLYSYNNEARHFYLDEFPEMNFILSDELTDRELDSLEDRKRMIYKAYGHQQLMITAQLMDHNYSKVSDSRDGLLRFRDARGNDFFAFTDEGDSSCIIYNGKPTYMLDKLEETGCGQLLLDFTIESPAETQYILEAAEKGWSKDRLHLNITRGHHYKGVE